MPQPRTLNVEKEELLARAAELQAPIPDLPEDGFTDYPEAPCALDMITDAADTMRFSARSAMAYLQVGETRRQQLAEALRNAAKYYEDTDGAAAEAIANQTSVSQATPWGVDADPAMLPDTPVAASADMPREFEAVKDRAWKLEQNDQGAQFSDFADAWDKHRLALQDAVFRFRPFRHWEGTGSDAVAASFESWKTWLTDMAGMCAQLAKQARAVVPAHKLARDQHVFYRTKKFDYEEIVKIEILYEKVSRSPELKKQYEDMFRAWQESSDGIIAEYQQNAGLPLSRLTPRPPPTRVVVDPPSPPEPDFPLPEPGVPYPLPGWGFPAEPEFPLPEPGVPYPLPGWGFPAEPEFPLPEPGVAYPMPSYSIPEPDVLDAEPDVPDFSDPSDLMSGLPSAGTPAMPSMPTDKKLADALNDLAGMAVPGLPAGGSPGLKPASVGLGGGGRDVPSAPLKPPFIHDASPAPARAGDAAGPGRGIPGAGGAMGGGGMGGAPIGGADRGAGKDGKRKAGDDETLYTEERPWTEGVIGIAGIRPAPTSER